MTQLGKLRLTFHNVEITEETVCYARRCARRLEVPDAHRGDDVYVMLERPDGSSVVHAFVAFAKGTESVHGHGEDTDELLALGSAFASARERLSVPAPRERSVA